MPAIRKPRDTAAESVSAHVRLTPREYARVLAMAARERRSVSAQLSLLVSQAIAALAATKEG